MELGSRREDDRLVEDEDEQAVLVEMQRMDMEGASYRKIAAMLAGRGVKPHRGAAWYASTMRAVLRSRIATACNFNLYVIKIVIYVP